MCGPCALYVLLPRRIRLRSDARRARGPQAPGDEKEVAVHHWLNTLDWMWMGAMMIVWILLIAVVGYAAVLVAWRGSEPHARHTPRRRSHAL